MSKFTTQLSNPPIYSSISKTSAQNYANSPLNQGNDSNQTQEDWQKWFQETTTQLNQSEFYGNPSILLNSDFYWERGIATPVVADGSAFSEKWNVTGNGIATFSIGYVAYPSTDSDNIGSLYYVNFSISVFSGNAGQFYAYQTQSGIQFLRRYQNRQIIMSAKITNNQTTTIQAQFAMVFTYNTSPADTIKSGVITIPNGVQEVSGTLNTLPLAGKTISGTPTVSFQLYFFGFTPTTDFNVQYIKAEMSTQPTILYVDHALEKTRIDNS